MFGHVEHDLYIRTRFSHRVNDGGRQHQILGIIVLQFRSLKGGGGRKNEIHKLAGVREKDIRVHQEVEVQKGFFERVGARPHPVIGAKTDERFERIGFPGTDLKWNHHGLGFRGLRVIMTGPNRKTVLSNPGRKVFQSIRHSNRLFVGGRTAEDVGIG